MARSDDRINEEADQMGEENDESPNSSAHAPRFGIPIDPDDDRDPKEKNEQTEKAGEPGPRPNPRPDSIKMEGSETMHSPVHNPQRDQDEEFQDSDGQKDHQDNEDDAQSLSRR